MCGVVWPFIMCDVEWYDCVVWSGMVCGVV